MVSLLDKLLQAFLHLVEFVVGLDDVGRLINGWLLNDGLEGFVVGVLGIGRVMGEGVVVVGEEGGGDGELIFHGDIKYIVF